MKKTSLVYDKAFKMIMDKETPASRKALSDLLGSIIGIKVESIHEINKERKDLFMEEKDTIQDLVVQFNGGNYANIEMQIVKDLYYEGRLFYYQGKLIMTQPLKGKRYDIKPVYEIMLLDDILYYDNPHLLHHFIYRSETGLKLTIGNIILVEMKKVDESNYNDNDLTRWIYYIRNCNNESKSDIIKEILEKSEGIRMANDIYNEISSDQWKYLHKAFQDKAKMDREFLQQLYEEKGAKKEKDRMILSLYANGVDISLIANSAECDEEYVKRVINLNNCNK